ncbi:hypothetical protein [Paenibacillus ehimensis]|uniref:Uncharacterized protein n=1 Tax=Paenibacillus ehimensis TaxID=79264 RepID=A0ABT8VKS9_9BACL|nr:hypothetical protein [Paenibacillus ehimensis]MDO3681592.1 hypothetical protein [Paenibacillus ehimensis]MEC0208608.1 hypothetical protein [Paenibacillus ehimensis]
MRLKYPIYFLSLVFVFHIFEKWPLGGSWKIVWIVLTTSVISIAAEKLGIADKKIPLAAGIIGIILLLAGAEYFFPSGWRKPIG